MIPYDAAEGVEGLKASPAGSRAEPSAGVKSLTEAGNDAFAVNGDKLAGGWCVRDEQSEGIGADVYCSSPDHTTIKVRLGETMDFFSTGQTTIGKGDADISGGTGSKGRVAMAERNPHHHPLFLLLHEGWPAVWPPDFHAPPWGCPAG